MARSTHPTHSTQLVIGQGEVGRALATVLDCDSRDLEPTGQLATSYPVLHIAYPWAGGFVHTTRMYADHYDADLVVVHSTTPVGTCDPEGWVHSPIRGKHPDLADGISVFIKHSGGKLAAKASELFSAAGLRTQTHAKAATTEAGKLWELAAYSVEIALQKNIHAWCLAHDLDPSEVYDDFWASYRDGWERLGRPEFIKQHLTNHPGLIGGHCCIEGTRHIPDAPWLRELLEPHSKPGLWEFEDVGGRH